MLLKFGFYFFQILRWSILTLSLLCLLISIANSQVVKKTVSVKTPERFSNVHKHFRSASHNYDAQHSVNIDRTQKVPSILKQFFVLAPFIVGSRNEHFDPALPEYEAIGEVLLNPASPLLTHEIFDTHQNPQSDGLPPQLFSISTRNNANPFLINAFPILPEDFLNSNGIEEGDPLVESPSQRVVKKILYSPYKISRTKTTVPGVHLRKSISVKSPERISNVISHFSPVQHVYSAIGNVIIDREIPIQNIKIERQRFSTPISNIFTGEQEFDLEPVLSETENNKRSKRHAGKHVEVHLPEHRTSHIDHFNPRGHHYDAIENVDFIPAIKSPTPILTVHKPENKLEKHVKVHLKEHRTSHIDHFNPRGHHYDAQEDVFISHGKRDRKPVKPKRPSVTVRKTYVRPHKVHAVRFENKRPEKKFKVKKHVEVHLPEHRTSHIDHFNPRSHQYDAEEDVSIHHGGNRKNTLSIKPYKPVVTLRKPVVRQPEPYKPKRKLQVQKHVEVHLPEHRISHIDHFNPRSHQYDAEEDVSIHKGGNRKNTLSIKPYKPAVTVRKSFVRQPEPYKPKRKLHVQKHVEVHLPEHRISHIDHFNPRQHHYDAEENVSIHQGDNRKNTLSIKPYKPVVTVRKPAVRQPIPLPVVHLQPKRPESRLKVEKHVVVHLPEHRVSHIDHFNPRQHHYDAREDVFISQGEQTVNQVPFRHQKPLVTVRKQFVSSSKPSINQGGNKVNTILVKPKTPTVNVRRPFVRQPPPQRSSLPVVRVKNKRPEGGLLVDKHVQVHLIEHRISHIDHFNPAQHHYNAREDVVIRQGQRPVAPTFKQPKIPAVKPHSEKTDVKFDGFDFGFLTPEVSTIDGYNLPTFSIEVKDSGTDTDNFSTFNFDSTSSENKYDDINSYLPPSTEKPYKPKVVTQRPPTRPPVPTIPPRRKGIDIRKHVEVHLKEHRISHIDHFNPASHHYDAEEDVEIHQRK